ncbi:hypothetical protein KJ830_05685 [bacterium]|nr:hypothetical protein [bacterium]
MELNDYPNPYDFSNPVIESDLLFGREEIIKEIDYYLDHTKKAGRSINHRFSQPL